MSYERDEAMRQQDATEAMIRMREPRPRPAPARPFRKLPEDPMGRDARDHVWCYELPSGQRIRLDRDHVRQHGAEALVRKLGLDPGPEGQRLPVYQSGRKIGTLPSSFDPDAAASTSVLFDIRPGDFKREGDGWTAHPSLGPGDLGALSDFAADRPEHYQPTTLSPEEEAAFAEGPGTGMEALLGRLLR